MDSVALSVIKVLIFFANTFTTPLHEVFKVTLISIAVFLFAVFFIFYEGHIYIVNTCFYNLHIYFFQPDYQNLIMLRC